MYNVCIKVMENIQNKLTVVYMVLTRPLNDLFCLYPSKPNEMSMCR